MTSTRVMDGNLNDIRWINISESRGELGIGNRVSFPTNLYLKKRTLKILQFLLGQMKK